MGSRLQNLPSRGEPRSLLGILAFGMVVGVILLYTVVIPVDESAARLVSENYYLEWAGRFGLIVAPPLATVLAVYHWLVTGKVFLSLLTVSLGSLLTFATFLCVVLAYLH